MGRRRVPDRLTGAWWARQRRRYHDPPPRFADLRDFRRRWDEASPREEADFVRWVFTETGMTYDEADSEVRLCTTLLANS